ncbi:hypothetical protein B4144_1381 [Bacillus atrophaeus]|nr:hypothetical protein B4144_1381 [Bacillus atrophaeus]
MKHVQTRWYHGKPISSLYEDEMGFFIAMMALEATEVRK